MKKLLFSLLAITAIFFVGCSNTATEMQQPIAKNYTISSDCDTSILVKVPVQSAINLCAGGKSVYNKITGWKDSTIFLKSHHTITILADSLSAKGWYYYPAGYAPDLKTETSCSGLKFWLPWILLVLLGAISLYYFLKGYREKVEHSNNHSDTVSVDAEQINALTNLVTAVSAGGGGTVEADGISIRINGVKAPLIHVENIGSNSHSGDINIIFGEEEEIDTEKD
ncbi:MAG: hypothetical protein KGI58_01340 [Patescibacteria group bacterium]|nr:hypothetical protein [Patescibacteria group bacterium]